MSKIVVDSSVILAVINQEPGHDKVTPELLSQAIMSTVNLAEVHGKLVNNGWDDEEAWEDSTGSVDEVIPFTAKQAKTAGSLIARTRSLGLSLGDRACLALALEQKSPVYTADRSWKNLKLGVRVHVIR